MSDRPQVIGRLIRTVTPFVGEDVRSVAIRYASLKRLTITCLLHSGIKMDEAHLTMLPLKRDSVEAFADLAGLDAHALYTETLGSLYRRSAIEGMMSHWRRVAPGMLRSDPEPWIRAHWQLACLPCDPDTGECLLHTCPACWRTLSWSRAERLHCCQVCSYDLRDVSPSQLTEPVQELARLMVGIVRRNPEAIGRLPRVIASATLDEQIALFGLLGTLRSLIAGTTPHSSVFLNVNGLELALAYPASFDGLVRDLLVTHEERDARMGWFVGALEIAFQVRLLPTGRIRTHIMGQIRKTSKDKNVFWLISNHSKAMRGGAPA